MDTPYSAVYKDREKRQKFIPNFSAKEKFRIIKSLIKLLLIKRLNRCMTT